MPSIGVNGTTLYYEERGLEDTGAEVVVFSHSYLSDHRHYEAQMAALEGRFRIIAYDHRCHGRSAHPPSSTMEEIYGDALGLLDALQIESCHWVGLSTGGFVGMRLAIREPARLRTLTLMSTSADAEPPLSRLRNTVNLGVVRVFGYKPVMKMALKTLYGPSFITDPKHREARDLWTERLAQNNIPAVVRFGLGIFGRKPVYEDLGSIQTPTLVIVGQEDSATPPDKARRIAQAIAHARLEIIPNAGHITTVVAPDQISALLSEFLQQQARRA